MASLSILSGVKPFLGSCHVGELEDNDAVWLPSALYHFDVSSARDVAPSVSRIAGGANSLYRANASGSVTLISRRRLRSSDRLDDRFSKQCPHDQQSDHHTKQLRSDERQGVRRTIAAKVFVRTRAVVTDGFANEVDAVNQYAATI